MNTKRCSSCQEEKPLDRFGRQSSTKSGRQSRCKDCCNAIHRAARQKPERRARQVRHVRAWKARNLAKSHAHAAVNRAVHSGRLVRPETCDACPAPWPLHAHHDNYDEPLVVVWLCVPCHESRHHSTKVAS